MTEFVGDPWRSLDELLERYDGDFRCEVMSETAWSGQLRLTLTNPDGAPARSIAFFSAGKASAESVCEAVLIDFFDWRAETGVELIDPAQYHGTGPLGE